MKLTTTHIKKTHTINSVFNKNTISYFKYMQHKKLRVQLQTYFRKESE